MNSLIKTAHLLATFASNKSPGEREKRQRSRGETREVGPVHTAGEMISALFETVPEPSEAESARVRKGMSLCRSVIDGREHETDPWPIRGPRISEREPAAAESCNTKLPLGAFSALLILTIYSNTESWSTLRPT